MIMAYQADDGTTYDVPRGTCPQCGGSNVQHFVGGLPSSSEFLDRLPPWVHWGGCDVIVGDRDRECESCGNRWTAEVITPEARGLLLELGQRIESKGRTLKVSQLDVSALPKIRRHLIEVARRYETVTYGELVAATGISHAPRGLGRLMDLISEDCFLTDEPSLAALAVNQTTHEVGEAFSGDAEEERNYVYEYWAE